MRKSGLLSITFYYFFKKKLTAGSEIPKWRVLHSHIQTDQMFCERQLIFSDELQFISTRPCLTYIFLGQYIIWFRVQLALFKNTYRKILTFTYFIIEHLKYFISVNIYYFNSWQCNRLKFLSIQVGGGKLLIKCLGKAVPQDVIEVFVMSLSNNSTMALTWEGESKHCF